MNILMLSNDMHVGGVATCIIDFSAGMLKKGHRVFVCCRGGAALEKLPSGVRFIEMNLHTRNPLSAVKNLAELARLVRREHIDIIHCHYRLTTLYAQLLHMLTGVEFIWQSHLIPIPHDFLHRLFTFRGKKAVAISQESRAFLMEKMRIPEKDIQVINDGIRPELYKRLPEEERAEVRRKYGIPDGVKTIVLLGRLSEQKGHEFLLSACERLSGEYRVILTGEGDAAYKRRLLDQIERSGLQDKVIFTGTVRPNEILSVCDVLALPSGYEGFCIVALEGMVHRTPVIRTKTGGYLDMADCVDGVEYGDVETLAELLRRNLENGEDVRRRVSYAYEQVAERWDIDRITDQYLRLYQL